MNAVFEPSLLFISDIDWLDSQKQDDFLEHLLHQLEMIDEYDICKIWWTDSLQDILVGNPNMHPWFGSDLRNPIIVTLSQKFYNRVENTSAYESVSVINPSLSVYYNNEKANDEFLKLTHSLMDVEEDFYFCVGLNNQLLNPNCYIFSCECKIQHKDLQPILINTADNWLYLLDIVERFFPKTIEEFDDKFERGMNLVQRKMFANKPYLFDYQFTKNFKKSVISRNSCREDIFIAVVKKLISTAAEAASSDLHDEFITKNKINEWRIRVTQRPTSTRIHYEVKKKAKTEDKDIIIFLNYYGEGEHDVQL
jgi:hypothetical protein